jgi:hypothetical protein
MEDPPEVTFSTMIQSVSDDGIPIIGCETWLEWARFKCGHGESYQTNPTLLRPFDVDSSVISFWAMCSGALLESCYRSLSFAVLLLRRT